MSINIIANDPVCMGGKHPGESSYNQV